MKEVYIDIDGTILNTCEGIKLYLKKQGYEFNWQKAITYGFDGDIGVDKSLVYSCFSKPEVYDLAPIFSGVKEAIAMLKAYGYKVFAYSQCDTAVDVINQRMSFIKKLGLESAIYLHKKPTIETGYAVFDDCIGVVEDWYNETEAKLFLINQPYNQEINNPKPSSLWKEIYRCENLFDGVKKLIKEDRKISQF